MRVARPRFRTVRSPRRANPIGLLLRRRAHAALQPSAESSRRTSSPGRSVRVTWTIARGLVQAIRGVLGLVPRGVPVRAIGRSTSRTVGDGRYQLLAPVGTGGGGTLYMAHDATLDRTVAVKLL